MTRESRTTTDGPVPALLEEVVAAPDRGRAASAFWDTLERAPLIGPAREIDGRRRHPVTFLWRAQDPGAEVMVHLNGITDAHREDLTPARLHRIEGTDLCHRTDWLPADGTWGYRIVELDRLPTDAGATRAGWLAIHEAGRPDPLNPRSQPHALGQISSLLVMPDAYQHPAWADTPGTAAPWITWELPGDGDAPRTLHHWQPAGASTRRRVLVLFDGEQWTALGLADAMERSGLDVEILLVDSHGPQRRAADLPYPERASRIVDAALARRATEFGGRVPADRVIVAGQSFGGLAAAGVALVRPDLAATAIVQSGSFWFTDGDEPRRHNPVPADLVRRLRAGEFGRPLARFHVQAGTDEGTMVDQAEHFHAACAGAGGAASLRVVTGGHDYAWWKHHLLRTLTDVVTD
ncbi:enterochelin esterase domain-containing protein [Occultella kanbiaonis]|uniref:enterochelin esterase domain-containing protein n=1 Tax=Occultella kanbiaonis TaxID=2675754 RepID=UPI0012B90C92|nr:enterochelin esterase domain-containing protein [Occultella kanbiaonis]